jgi:hypothetical protein
MRDLYQVLREKEQDVVRVRKEIEALRAIIPLLDDDNDFDESTVDKYPSLRTASHHD